MPLNSFKNSLKEYLTFNNREKKAIFILLFLIVVAIGVLVYLRYTPNHTKIDFSEFDKEIDAFENQMKPDSVLELSENENLISENNIPESEPPSIELFEFNPNHLADSLWLKLGVHQKIIHTIKNYESKGGKFYKKEDLKKIYGFDEKDFARLEPYIVIPSKIDSSKIDSSLEKTKPVFQKPAKTIVSFDLNNVTAFELKTLYGIGDVKANSIVKYRTMLGGFLYKEQLLEIYGMDSLLYESIKNNVDVKTKNIRTININTANEPEFKHPYISYQLAKILVNYRKMHGNFKAIEEIKKIPLVNDELYLKLAPYLALD